MDINTGKLASNSINFLKKIKDNDLNVKIDKIKNKESLNELIDYDALDVNINDRTYKSRVINIQNQISKYENELSKTQFISQKLDEIELLMKGNNETQIKEIINKSEFDNQLILKDLFSSKKDFSTQITEAKNMVSDTLEKLDNEYSAIKIAYQNIISSYTIPVNLTNETLMNLNFEEVIKTSQLNNKRVLNLIS
ncbi:MAG: hypothetical protein JXB50_04065 [Spirochaetes bacterium]|nr:hypothetical protein [Spirochaetota bacterium]